MQRLSQNRYLINKQKWLLKGLRECVQSFFFFFFKKRLSDFCYCCCTLFLSVQSKVLRGKMYIHVVEIVNSLSVLSNFFLMKFF